MSAKADLAVRTVIYLARQHQAPVPLDALAQAVETTPVLMNELMTGLLKAKIVEQPGPKGGYRLLRRPESLSFYDVMSTTEMTTQSARLRSTTHTKQLDQTRAQLEATYRAMTIAHYLRDGAKS